MSNQNIVSRIESINYSNSALLRSISANLNAAVDIQKKVDPVQNIFRNLYERENATQESVECTEESIE